MENLNFAAKITQFFLKNKALTKLLILGIIATGIFGYVATPKQYNPTISLPAFQVSVNFYGATAHEVQRFITKELEEKIAEIPGIDKVSSRSIDGGRSIVIVKFLAGENLDQSKVKLWTKITSNYDLRVPGMSQPMIKTINPDNVPVLTIGISSNKISQNELRNFAIGFSDKFRGIKGIANIDVKGGKPKALKISLDPGLMKFFGVSVKDVKNAILANNLRVNAGSIKNGQTLKAIEFNGNFLNVKDAENLIVIPGVKLGDFAKIKNDYLEKNSYVESFDKYSPKEKNFVVLSFAKRKGENIFNLTKEILDTLEKNENINPDIKFKVIRNDGLVAKDAVNGLGINLIESILIVLIILYLFLGFRPAIVVASSIPMTLLLVFFIGYFLDQTINRITLFALILSLGLLVDSATVATENIHRHLEDSKDKEAAIINAMNEVGIGLFLSTLTSVIVFLPTSQLSGMMGSYMGALSVYVPLSLTISLLIAYMVVPFLALYLLKIKKEDVTELENKKTFFDKVIDKYGKVLKVILNNKKLQKGILIGTFGLFFSSFLMPIFQFTHFKMLPISNKNQFYVYIDGKDGTDLQATKTFTEHFLKKILEDKNVKSIQAYIGESPVLDFNGLFKGANLRNGENLSTIRVNLTDKSDRSLKSNEIVEGIRKEFLSQKDRNKNFKTRFVQDPPGPPVQATLVAKVKGENPEVLKKFAKDVEKMFSETDKVYDINTSLKDDYSKIIYRIDSEKALRSGISSAQISDTLKTLLRPQKISQFHKKDSNEISYIELGFPKKFRDKNIDLSEIYLKNQKGKIVNFDSVVKKIQTRDPEILFRDQFEDTIYVSAEMGHRSVVYGVIDIMKKLFKYSKNGLELDSWNLYGVNFSDKNGKIYKVEWGGEFKMTIDNSRDLRIAMLFALILIYSVLVAQFRNFKEPALVMATIPLGLIGILFGFSFLDFFGIYLTSTALIGFIALMGIVVNNAIIYLEYLHILRSEGMEEKEALIKTGKTRLRPIVLTSITSILGLLTIASDPVWSGLSWSVIFGLSISTFMTLFILPILISLNGKKNNKK